MRIGQVDITSCSECPALRWRGENSSRASSWDFYCGFSLCTLAFDHRSGIAENCPIEGMSSTSTVIEDMTMKL